MAREPLRRRIRLRALRAASSVAGVLPAPLMLGSLVEADSAGGVDKRVVREQAVSVMNLALACWERELGRSKLDLAEQSRIWPVYIDKSTPTTRTLDKYLNLDNCPKNPRSKRVVDTAEAIFEVDDYEGYVAIQSEAALRNMATSYPYEAHQEDEVALRSKRMSLEESRQLIQRFQQVVDE